MKSIQTLFRILLPVFLFLGLPIFVLDFGVRFMAGYRNEILLRGRYSLLDSRLSRLKVWSDPEFFLRKTLRGVARRLERSSEPFSDFKKVRRVAERRFPGLFSFTFFGEDGKVKEAGGGSSPAKVGEKVLRTLQDFYLGRGDRFSGNEALIAGFLGSSKGRTEVLKEGDPLIRISGKPRRSWFFFHLGKRFSLLCNIHREGMPEFAALPGLLSAPGRSSLRYHVVDMEERCSRFPVATGESALLERIAVRLETEPQDHFVADGRVWGAVPLDSRFTLLASVPDDSEALMEKTLFRFRVSASLFFLFIAMVVIYFAIALPGQFISIRWKLLLLFLISAGLPLIVLSFLGFIYFDQLSRSLERLVADQAVRLLGNFDEGLDIAARRCGKKLKGILDTASTLDVPGSPFRQRIRQFSREFHCSTLFLLNEKGEETPLVNLPGNFRSRNNAVKGLYRKVLRNLEGGKNESGREGSDSLDFISAVMGEDSGDFLDGFLSRVGTVFFQELGPLTGYIFFSIVRTGPGFPPRILGITWAQEDMVENFLRFHIPFKPLEDGTEILAVQRAPLQPGNPAPKREPHFEADGLRVLPAKRVSKNLREFLVGALESSKPVHRKVVFRGKPFFATSIPGNRVQGFHLVALRPCAPVEDELRSLWWKIYASAVLSVFFAGSLSFLLSRKVLQPIGELSDGMTAIARKNFKYQIPTLDSDEFGLLSQTFNQVIGSLHEMTIGGMTQQQLFPTEVLETSDYRVFGTSRPATELGGDYLDYFVSGNTLFALMGDVTGHGLPSALVMAMANAVVTTNARKEAPAEDTLSALNHVLYSRMKKRKLRMTMGMALVDLVSHQVSYFNGGHPFPLRRGVDGNVTMLDQAYGYGLGIRKDYLIQPIVFPLDPGERLILYTDGLVESLPIGPNEDGFILFKEFVQKQPELPIVESCLSVIESHPYWKTGLPQPDDMSILIIERKRK